MTNLNRDDMVSMFEFPLRRTYELLGDQLEKARRVKNVTMKVRTTRKIAQSAGVTHQVCIHDRRVF